MDSNSESVWYGAPPAPDTLSAPEPQHEDERHVRLRTDARYFLLLSLALGAVWEIYEFTMDSVFGTNMQKYMLDNGTALIGQAALQDTMKDIIVDAIGALVMSTIGYISLKYKKGWVEKLMIRFHVKKPEKTGKPKRERMNEHER